LECPAALVLRLVNLPPRMEVSQRIIPRRSHDDQLPAQLHRVIHLQRRHLGIAEEVRCAAIMDIRVIWLSAFNSHHK
jgi:hypothetical protein